MPIFIINTNVHELEIPSDFLIKTSELMADMFGTPIKHSVLQVNTNQNMYWSGKVGKCVMGTLKILSIAGQISPEQNVKHAQILVKHIADNFKIPDENITISFNEMEMSNVTIFRTTVLEYTKNLQ